MAFVTIKVRNKDRLLARLKAKIPKIEDAVEDASETSAEEMAEMMRRLVPVRTGALRDSIAVTGPGETTPGGKAVPQGAVMITAGNKQAFYAAMVEFGTVDTPAANFFFSSYRANRKRAKGRIARAISKAIKG